MALRDLERQRRRARARTAPPASSGGSAAGDAGPPSATASTTAIADGGDVSNTEALEEASRVVRETNARLGALMVEAQSGPTRRRKDEILERVRRLEGSEEYVLALRLVQDPVAERARRRAEVLEKAEARASSALRRRDLVAAEAAANEVLAAGGSPGTLTEEVARLRDALEAEAAAAELAEASRAHGDPARLAGAIAEARHLGLPPEDIEHAELLLGEIPDEAEARRRRKEARKGKQDQAKWNFSGRSGATRMNDRVREHDEELEKRRRMAFSERGRFRQSAEAEDETAQERHIREQRQSAAAAVRLR